MSFRWKAGFAVFLLGLLTDPDLVRADERVPFRGRFQPVITAVTPVDATHLRFDITVLARATLLGKSHGPAYFLLDVTDMSYVGETTWYGARGDSIDQVFVGQFVPTATPGLFDNVEAFVVVGGTGRFAGVTGQGSAAGQFNAITLSAPAPVPFEGYLSFPCGHRH